MLDHATQNCKCKQQLGKDIYRRFNLDRDIQIEEILHTDREADVSIDERYVE